MVDVDVRKEPKNDTEQELGRQHEASAHAGDRFVAFDFPCGRTSVQLGLEEWRRLWPGQMVNDNVIDFYMAYIMKTKATQGVIAESPLFSAKLQSSNKVGTQWELQEVCRRWPNARKTLQAELFLVPWCDTNRMHWSLFGVHKPWKLIDTKNDQSGASIVHWDSYSSMHAQHHEYLRLFLKTLIEHNISTADGTHLDPYVALDSKRLPLRKMPTPQQRNSTDCGFIMMDAAVRACKGAGDPSHMYGGEGDHVDAESLASEMRTTLHHLFLKQGVDDSSESNQIRVETGVMGISEASSSFIQANESAPGVSREVIALSYLLSSFLFLVFHQTAQLSLCCLLVTHTHIHTFPLSFGLSNSLLVSLVSRTAASRTLKEWLVASRTGSRAAASRPVPVVM